MTNGTIDELEALVCSLVVAPEPGEVAHLLGVLDRLTARVTAAVGELDAA
ncbi:MAG: hypothetical protein H0V33_09320, partial [Acidimicrobiia bacterium]|nr:hypothetical protein [Acidimicrobiia bacterium]